METQEKFKTYADVFGELPRNVQYNLRGAVCKTLNIKASDFYRLLAYAFDGTAEYARGTFFCYMNDFISQYNDESFRKQYLENRLYLGILISFGTPKSIVVNERKWIIQARNEAVIQNRPAPELYPETFLKPYWNETKTAMVTRHGVGDTRITKPLKKKKPSTIHNGTLGAYAPYAKSMFIESKHNKYAVLFKRK